MEMDGVPPILWIREKVLDILFASISELYGQRNEDSIRWVSKNGNQQALSFMCTGRDYVSPEDHMENILLKLAPSEGSFVEVY